MNTINKRIAFAQDPKDKKIKTFTSPQGAVIGHSFALNTATLSSALIYSIPQRQRIVRQMKIVLEEFYVHLSLKEKQFGYDTIRALALLEVKLASLSDVEFFQSITQLVARTRDRHLTFYGNSGNGTRAYLPFRIEKCWINSEETYVVSTVANIPMQYLQKGAIVTHWNGIPIAKYIRLNANFFDGSNEAASLARSIEFLTNRPINRFSFPIESWVKLTFTVNSIPYEEKFDWQGFDVGLAPDHPFSGRALTGFGGDPDLIDAQQVKRSLFAPKSFDTQQGGEAEQGFSLINSSVSNFAYRTNLQTASGTFGYIRLWHFRAGSPDEILNAMVPVLDRMPKEGLIIDIRGNSGGWIAAGERLLQLFTPNTIVPTRFQFRVTEGTRRLMSVTSYFNQWTKSMEEAHLTGEEYTQGFPIEGTDADANQVGQRYFGPVLIITDALSFSTADMFTAGFIDHSIGKVLSVDKNMAAAGGNNWQFDVLKLFLPDFKVTNSYSSDLDNGLITSQLRDEFNRNGISLSQNASLSTRNDQYEGRLWEIEDGGLIHRLRLVTWMSNEIVVYLNESKFNLTDLPSSVAGFGFTIRRCIRTGLNEGRLLEDLGIKPDIEYQMTLDDILSGNPDLINTAGSELSQLDVFDLKVKIDRSNSLPRRLQCTVHNIQDLEFFDGNRHLLSKKVPASGTVEFEIPNGLTLVTIKGFNQYQLVAWRLVEV